MFSYFKKKRELSSRIRQIEEEVGSRQWYYYIDFGYGVKVGKEHRRDKSRGYNNWKNFLAQNLPPLQGLRVLDIGCNAGIYALEMNKNGAEEVVGLDLDVRRAEFVKESLAKKDGRSYGGVRFIGADVSRFDFLSLGRFDLVCMFSVIYHLGDHIERIFTQLREMTPSIALQGNTARMTSQKYKNRRHQELGGVDGMVELLRGHGFEKITIKAPPGYERPLVIGGR